MDEVEKIGDWYSPSMLTMLGSPNQQNCIMESVSLHIRYTFLFKIAFLLNLFPIPLLL